MKKLFLDLDVKGLKLLDPDDDKNQPNRVCANWIENLIVLAEREKHGPKGAPSQALRFIAKIIDKIELTVDGGDSVVDFEDDQYQFVRRCMNDAKVDPQNSLVVSRVLDCLERSEDANREKKEGEK